MLEINETKKILGKLEQIHLNQTEEDFKKNYEFALNLRRESNHKAGYSGIRAKDCYVTN